MNKESYDLLKELYGSEKDMSDSKMFVFINDFITTSLLTIFGLVVFVFLLAMNFKY